MGGTMASFRLLLLGSLLALTRLRQCSGKRTPTGEKTWDGDLWFDLYTDDEAPRPYGPKSDSWKKPDTTIFIGVSAFRDLRCPKTLVNYFTKARNPDRVTIGLVLQNDVADPDCVKEYCKLMGAREGPECPHWDQIRPMRIQDRLAAGPCFGRHLQTYLLRDEEFCMQTDSHMGAVQDWDQILLDMWGRADNEYGVLTTYVNKEEHLIHANNRAWGVPHLCQVMFTADKHPRYVQAKMAKGLRRPKLTNTWAAGFNFAKCHAWRAVPYDPHLRMVFDGEEFSMHIRLWTRGYDTYTPDRLAIGHDYNGVKKGEGPPPSSWLKNNLKSSPRFGRLGSYLYLHEMLGMPKQRPPPPGWGMPPEEDLKRYGLGDKRTVQQYQEFVGVNLSALNVTTNRCGTIQWVPFEETWPPTENNLRGPYWERVLSGRGVHAEDYASAGSRLALVRAAARAQTAAGGSGGGRGHGAAVAALAGEEGEEEEEEEEEDREGSKDVVGGVVGQGIGLPRPQQWFVGGGGGSASGAGGGAGASGGAAGAARGGGGAFVAAGLLVVVVVAVVAVQSGWARQRRRPMAAGSARQGLAKRGGVAAAAAAESPPMQGV